MMFGGGLGNQLFQYAFLYSQIKENNPEINQIYAIMHHNKIEDSRNFLLKNFKTTIDMKLINENSANKYLKNKLKQKNFIIRIQNKLHLSNSSTIKLLKLFNIISVNDIYKYYNELRINKRLCFVEGAFQS